MEETTIRSEYGTAAENKVPQHYNLISGQPFSSLLLPSRVVFVL